MLLVELCLVQCLDSKKLTPKTFDVNQFQPGFICSKSTMETPKQCKVNSKDSCVGLAFLLLKLKNRFHTFFWFFQLLTLKK